MGILLESVTESPLLMLDADHFKEINDAYGHSTGDQVLSGIGKTLLECLRGHDVAGRYGGEEFSVILPESSEEDAYLVAERLRLVVEKTSVQIENGHPLNITVSIGVAQALPGENMNQVLSRADQALYLAKQTGRNRVIRASAAKEAI